MKKHFSAFLLLNLALAVVAGLSSFTMKTDFSGSWTFNESKSDMGDSQFRFAWQTMAITQSSDLITITRHGEGQNGPFDIEDKVKLNGEVSESNSFGDSVRKLTAKWSADGNSLIISSETDFNGNSFKQTETFSLSGGGKILTVKNETKSDFGDTSQSLVYEKK